MVGCTGAYWYLAKKNTDFFIMTIRGMNEKGAKRMAINMGDEDDFNERGQWPAFYAADCSKQDNNWACGAYLMHFMEMAIKKIGEGRGKDIGTMKPLQYAALKTRDKLRQTLEELVQKEEVVITYEKGNIGKGGEEKKQDAERTERKTSKQDEDEKMEVTTPVTHIEKNG